jgi:hypothetical protein
MKITLEFDSNDEFERAASVRAQKADDIYYVVYSFDNWLRNEIKHNPEYSEREAEILYKIRNKLSKELENKNINMDEEYV